MAEHGVRCSECTWRQTVAPGLLHAWVGSPCLRFRCPGRFVQDVRTRAGEDFYRRLYFRDRPGDVLTAEHTGALSKPKRQHVERAFKRRTHPFDPNVLTCTPTLELGIDIGDLSAVLLTSVPPGPAQYAQRIGRAGRATGNALVTAFVPRRARNQYYLHRPTAMLAGRIVPPACYLNAAEILRRHYLAYLFDRAADWSLWEGTAAPTKPMPRWIGELFQSGLDDAGGWLRRLLDVSAARHEVLSARFIALFPGIGEDARRAVEEFAQTGIELEVGKAVSAWRRRREELQQRLAGINTAFDAIPIDTTDSSRRDDRRALFAELKAVRRRLDGLVKENSVNALVRLGLLPNYTLHDDPTFLDAALWWKDPDGEFQETEIEYGRSAGLALTELAPGNTFHADGSKFIVDGMDIGTSQHEAYTTWRFCRACGYVLTEGADVVLQRCPRCKDAGIADLAASGRRVLVPERTRARERREDARITDERDERDQRRYVTVTLVDIDSQQPQGLRAWRNADRFFGVEFAREAVIRQVNFGPDGVAGADFDVAGETIRAPGFQTCRYCGAVQGVHPQAYDREARRIGTRHARWCPQRDLGIHKEETVTLVTGHELRTHALRLLLPFSTTLVPKRAVSFRAALMLGITKYFGGEPDHIRAVMATMPGDDRDTPRQFLVLHDTMPGGTGYLENLADPQAMERVLRLALAHIQTCPCGKEERQPCHRCLLPFVSSSQHELVSKETAAELLTGILDGWRPERIQTLADIQINALADSELERLFVETLRAKADKAHDDPAARDRFSLISRAGSRGVEFELKLKPDNGPAVRWRMRDHVIQSGAVRSEPDYLLNADDGMKIAIFLDGYAFHASAGNNEIAADAAKRASLRDDGTWVWQLTWDDVPVLGGKRRTEHRRVRPTAGPDDRSSPGQGPRPLLRHHAKQQPHRWAARRRPGQPGRGTAGVPGEPGPADLGAARSVAACGPGHHGQDRTGGPRGHRRRTPRHHHRRRTDARGTSRPGRGGGPGCGDPSRLPNRGSARQPPYIIWKIGSDGLVGLRLPRRPARRTGRAQAPGPLGTMAGLVKSAAVPLWPRPLLRAGGLVAGRAGRPAPGAGARLRAGRGGRARATPSLGRCD